MKKHPTEQILIGHLDGELPEPATKRVARHLFVCDRCARTVADLNRTGQLVGETLRLFDEVAPPHWNRHRAVAGAALRPKVVGTQKAPNHARVESIHSLRPARQASPVRRRTADSTAQSWRWAAGFVLVFAAAASAAVFGLPALPWSGTSVLPPSTPANGGEEIDAAPAAVIVRPAGGRMEVVLSNAGAGSWLRVSFEDRSDVRVTVGGVATPDFFARDGRVTVDLSGAEAFVTVTLPNDLSGAELRVEARVLVRVRDGRVDPSEALAGGVSVFSEADSVEAAGVP